MSPRRTTPARDPAPLRGPLGRAAEQAPGGEKPDALTGKQSDKKNYAQTLSNELATMMADCLRDHYGRARITPRQDGSGQEFTIGAKIDSKKTDVGVWDDAAGLILGVSIKTYSFRDFHGPNGRTPAHLGRYQRNVKRNDMELRDEADILHRRQPFAVLFALFFLPLDSAWDGVNGHSSFAHVVFTLRKRTGRSAADASRTDLFEKVYVGLFTRDGEVSFFDVGNAPPRNQPPRDTITLSELVEIMRTSVIVRNEGVSPEERYAVDDPAWVPPEGSLPEFIETERPLEFEEALEDEPMESEDDPD